MSQGAKPPGAADEEEAARWVRGMFSRITPRYDLLNHLLSMNLDRYWRHRTARRVRHVLERPGTKALDLCCGTGDLLLALQSQAASETILIGLDFARPMLKAASGKLARKGVRPLLIEADALRLPLPEASMDLITVAFGFRNFANYNTGLVEMRRVLRPSGVAAILEFSQPKNAALSTIYEFYSRRVLPLVGGALSGARDAYKYLPDSVRKFPNPEELAAGMEAAGFRQAGFELLNGGIVALHTGFA